MTRRIAYSLKVCSVTTVKQLRSSILRIALRCNTTPKAESDVPIAYRLDGRRRIAHDVFLSHSNLRATFDYLVVWFFYHKLPLARGQLSRVTLSVSRVRRRAELLNRDSVKELVA